mgnify:CR=1 FL=1
MVNRDRSLPAFSIERTEALRLAATRSPWPFATTHRDAIAAYWRDRVADNPALFDGEVLVLRSLSRRAGGVDAELSLERFSAFLYWRDGLCEDDGRALDAFASAIVRSAEGHVLVGKASAGTLNAGRFCLPGGFLDARDPMPDGRIDAAASAARELHEETGLAADELTRAAGTIVALHGRHCCLATEFVSPLDSVSLARTIRDRASGEADGELAEIAFVRSASDLDRLDLLDHARFVIASVLAGAV